MEGGKTMYCIEGGDWDRSEVAGRLAEPGFLIDPKGRVSVPDPHRKEKRRHGPRNSRTCPEHRFELKGRGRPESCANPVQEFLEHNEVFVGHGLPPLLG